MAAPGHALTPTQQKALQELLGVVRPKAASLVEIISPPALGRGHGITTVLRAVAVELGVPLLGLSTVLEESAVSSDLSRPARVLHAAALRSLKDHGVAVIDDLDLASAPLSIKRSRTLIGDIKGAGEMYNWDVAPAPAMLLKALGDAAAAMGAVLIFSTVEDAHLAFSRAPFSVTLGEPDVKDYAAVLENVLGPSSEGEVSASALYALHSQLSAAELAATTAKGRLKGLAEGQSKIGTAELLAAIRSELIATSAVAPEEVEEVDLGDFPGMESIKDELERKVLFPLENPELAGKLGLAPKRGVLLHGQPGTGKTTVGRWLAHRLRGKFFLVREMMLQSDIVKVFAAAQAAAPAVVFIDDADIVIGGWRPLDGGRGSDIFRFLLGRMDGLTSRAKSNGDVVVMLTGQNVHWMADMLLRSGRIELWLKTKLPGPKQKQSILHKYIQEDKGASELLMKDGKLPDVKGTSQLSDHFCCADLRRIVSDAKTMAAWDLHDAQRKGEQVPPNQDGKFYLEKAAAALRSMQEEVKENTRGIYG